MSQVVVYFNKGYLKSIRPSIEGKRTAYDHVLVGFQIVWGGGRDLCMSTHCGWLYQACQARLPQRSRFALTKVLTHAIATLLEGVAVSPAASHIGLPTSASLN